MRRFVLMLCLVMLFVGSILSDKYHNPGCRHAARILPENLITFASRADAQAAGYIACLVCRP